MTYKPYEFLDHTSEIKILARGETLEEAFDNMAKATFEVMTDTDKIKEAKTKHVTVKAQDEEKLLYDFIDELIYLLDTEAFLLKRLENTTIKKNDELELTTKLIGDTQDDVNKYDVKSYIKSPTLSDLAIKKGKLYEITLVPDI